MKNTHTQYAISCMAYDENDLPVIFFVKFNTQNEKDAQKLAQCAGAPSDKALLLLDNRGVIW